MTFLTVWYENPAIVGLILAIPSAVLGYLGWQLTKGRDAAVKDAAVASGQAMWMELVQQDNKDLREEVRELRRSVIEIQARIDAVELGSTSLRARNQDLEREIADLRAENETLKAENVTLRARVDEIERTNGGSHV